jgi:hypothetical protein
MDTLSPGGPTVSGSRVRKDFGKDAEKFIQVDDRLKKLAHYLQPFHGAAAGD